MAILSEDSSTADHPEQTLKIDNGDLEGLSRVMDKYGFIDHQAALRFAMVALLDAEDNRIYVKKENGMNVLQPNDKLVNKPTVTEGETNSDGQPE